MNNPKNLQLDKKNAYSQIIGYRIQRANKKNGKFIFIGF